VGAPIVGKDAQPAEDELEWRTSAGGNRSRLGDSILLFRGSLTEKPQGDMGLIRIAETKKPRWTCAYEPLLGSCNLAGNRGRNADRQENPRRSRFLRASLPLDGHGGIQSRDLAPRAGSWYRAPHGRPGEQPASTAS
jgi:hypothetical protein